MSETIAHAAARDRPFNSFVTCWRQSEEAELKAFLDGVAARKATRAAALVNSTELRDLTTRLGLLVCGPASPFRLIVSFSPTLCADGPCLCSLLKRW